MKFTIFIIILFSFTSCSQNKESYLEKTPSSKQPDDTIIVKHENVLDTSYEVGFYSKRYSYYWLVGNDTLDFFISATEYEKDRTLQLRIHHKHPLLFMAVLDNIDKCIPLIKNDFEITKLSSISFKSPINYLDLTIELSKDYEQKFGRKIIIYQKLNEFLLASSLNKQLDKFLNPFDKKVKRYHIEKFRLIEKKDFSTYLPGIDLTDYPEFTIDGYTGVNVQIEKK